MRLALFCLSLLVTTSPVLAQEALGLAAPDTIVQSGLLKHILPRFSLKTGVRVVHDPAGAMQLDVGPPGVPVFRGGGVTYYLRTSDTKRQQRFRKWMLSDIGKNTIEGFQPDGSAPFSADMGQIVTTEAPAFRGNAVLGGQLSLTHCGRCHVIGPQNAMSGLGSTPSFAVLRSLPDWDERFQQFYVRKPHGAFTQIDGVTAPFAPNLPSPIYPLRITPGDLEAILAFATTVAPADLGKPLQTQ